MNHFSGSSNFLKPIFGFILNKLFGKKEFGNQAVSSPMLSNRLTKYFIAVVAAVVLYAGGTAEAQIVGDCNPVIRNIPNPAVFPGGGQSNNVFGSTVRRVQCFYDSTNWTGQGVTGAIKITKLDFRAFSAVATSRTYSNVEIYVQQANVDYLSPSTTFANNRRSALGTPNYSGAITVNAGDSGTYQIQVPLTVPFTYDPTQGDLLVELVFLSSPSPAGSVTIDCGFSAASHKCNSVRSAGTTSATTGSVSAFAPVLRTTHKPIRVNESSCGAYNWNFNGQTYTQSGSYTEVNSCGDTLTLNLTVKPTSTSSTTEITTGSYNWNGNTYTTSGVYTWTGTNSVGCDSVATLNLTICSPTASTETINACNSYVWHGTTYTSSNNTATWTGTNAAGCDSVVTLNLTINLPSTSTTTISRCGSYTWNGQLYTTSGTYTWTGINAVGCDSVATLNLTINQPTSSTVSETTTGSYTWNGQTYTSSGTYSWTGTNAAGCDSVVTLNLTINTLTINSITNVCPYIGTNQTVSYTASVAGASSYNWTLPAFTQLVSGQGTRSITIRILNGFANVNNKQLRVTPAGGSLQIIYLSAQAPVTPASISASSSSVCSSLGTNVPIIYTIPRAYAAASYIWSVQNGNVNITSINGAGANDTTVALTFTPGFTSSNITVQSVNDCGVSGSRSLTITKDVPPTPGLISGPANVCEYIGEAGQSATYTVSAISNVDSYNWSLPNGAFAVTGQGTRSISFKYPAGFINGSVSVTTSNGCGTSSARSLNINRLQSGTPSIIDVINTNACPNRTYTYTLSAMPSNATSVQWTVPAGGTIVSGQGTTSITVSYANTVISGDVRAQAVNNCSVSGYRNSSVKLAACPAPGFTSNKVANTLSTEGLSVIAFPNPTTSSFNFQVITAGSKEVKVKIMDVQGRMIKSLIVVPYQTTNIGNDLKSGVYMVETRQGGEVNTIRIVKL